MAKAKTGWKQVLVSERGKQRKRLALTREVLWYKVCPDKLVRLVISRDPEGKQHDDFFFTTDLSATAAQVIGQWPQVEQAVELQPAQEEAEALTFSSPLPLLTKLQAESSRVI